MNSLQPSNIDVEDVAHARLQIIIDDEVIGLDADAAETVLRVVESLREGKNIDFVESTEFLTTQEAADLMGVSRPTLVKMLDDGVIPCIRPGTHRKVRREDVEHFLNTRQQRRAKALEELHATEEAEGPMQPDMFVPTR